LPVLRLRIPHTCRLAVLGYLPDCLPPHLRITANFLHHLPAVYRTYRAAATITHLPPHSTPAYCLLATHFTARSSTYVLHYAPPRTAFTCTHRRHHLLVLHWTQPTYALPCIAGSTTCLPFLGSTMRAPATVLCDHPPGLLPPVPPHARAWHTCALPPPAILRLLPLRCYTIAVLHLWTTWDTPGWTLPLPHLPFLTTLPHLPLTCISCHTHHLPPATCVVPCLPRLSHTWTVPARTSRGAMPPPATTFATFCLPLPALPPVDHLPCHWVLPCLDLLGACLPATTAGPSWTCPSPCPSTCLPHTSSFVPTQFTAFNALHCHRFTYLTCTTAAALAQHVFTHTRARLRFTVYWVWFLPCTCRTKVWFTCCCFYLTPAAAYTGTAFAAAPRATLPIRGSWATTTPDLPARLACWVAAACRLPCGFHATLPTACYYGSPAAHTAVRRLAALDHTYPARLPYARLTAC